MATIAIHELFQMLSEETKFKERVRLLKKYDHFAIRTIMSGCFDPRIKFLFPSGKIPYTPADDELENRKALYGYVKRFDTLVEGGKAIPEKKRELGFLKMMNDIHPLDAIIIERMVNKLPPAKNITSKLVRAAYPSLLPEDDVVVTPKMKKILD